MAKVKFIYATGGGNTELTCGKVAAILKSAGHEPELLQAKLTNGAELSDYDVLVFACPTYGQGELEPYFIKFLSTCNDVDFKGKKCCVIALGDIKYGADHVLAAENIITEFLEKKGADIIVRPLKIANSPILYLDTLITKWSQEFADAIDGKKPQADAPSATKQ